MSRIPVGNRTPVKANFDLFSIHDCLIVGLAGLYMPFNFCGADDPFAGYRVVYAIETARRIGHRGTDLPM